MMETREGRGGLVAGIILVVIGVITLLINFHLVTPNAFLLGIGIAFLVAYAVWRRLGFLIAGMILSWLGVATILTTSHVFVGSVEPALFTLALGLAFVSIYLFMGRGRRWWPLVPGGVLLVFGLTSLVAALNLVPFTVAQLTNIIWPTVLILVGVWLVIRQLVRR